MKRHVLTALLLCVALCLPALAMAEGEAKQKIDVVWLIDTTGSISTRIPTIKNQMDGFADQLKDFDVRYGLAGFGDETSTNKYSGYDYPEVTKMVRLGDSYWTSDVSRLKAYLEIGPNKLPKYSGDDQPETSTNAVYDVATGYDWREDALRFIILVTDAPPKEAGDYGEIGGRHVVVKSMDTVIEKCKELSISLSVASLNNDSSVKSAYEGLETKTGVKYQYVGDSTTLASIGEWVRSYPVVIMTPETVDAGKKVSVIVTFNKLNHGEPTNHHYQKKMPSEGSQWVNLTDNLNDNYVFTSSAEESPDGTRFRWMGYINGILCYSNEVTLSLFDIKTDPTSKAVDAGADVDFTIEATGDAAGYRWEKRESSTWTPITDGESVSGATSTKLQLSGVKVANSGEYRCVAKSERNTTLESGTATLTVFDITKQPEPLVDVDAGKLVSFAVEATGDVARYQWEKLEGSTWKPVSGATNATLQLSSVKESDSGTYHCVVTSKRTTTKTSDPVTLTVAALPVVTWVSGDVFTEDGLDATFEVKATGDGLTFQWQEEVNGVFTAIPGATGTKLTVTASPEKNGRRYRCVVKNRLGTEATSTPATLTVANAPAITLQPKSLSVAVGQDASFTIEATGYDLRYQWQVRTENGFADCPDGQTDTLTLKARKLTDDASVYRCVVRSGFGTELTSDEATLSVLALPDLPETGDSSQLWRWAALCAACAGVLVAMKRRR